MKTPSVVFIGLLFLCAGCIKKTVKHNLDDWRGEWTISTVKQGDKTGFMHDFLDKKWKDGEIVHEEFGSLLVDKDGNATLTFQNNDFSDTLLPFTAKGYLHDYGQAHLELYGLKIVETADPDFSVGQEICDNGNLIFWLRDRFGGKRVVQYENMQECGMFGATGIEWLVFEKK